MITWFSAGPPRAWLLTLALFAARAARADEPAAPIATPEDAPAAPPADAPPVIEPPPAPVTPPPAPPPAPAVVVASPPPPPPRVTWPPSFELGARSALMAKDAAGGEHIGAGLVFSWLTLATRHSRGSIVFDLESTRWEPGRADRGDRAQVAFYGAGFDWAVPFVRRRGAVQMGAALGAEATGGVLQTSSMTTPAVGSDGVLLLMPHAGGVVAYRGVGLFVDAGWRFQLLASDSSGQASVGGLVLQGGLRVDMPAGEPRDAAAFHALDVGYEAHFFSPNGSRIYGRYGGLPFGGGAGPMLEHELRVTTGARLPRRLDLGLAVTYLGAAQAGGGAALDVAGLNLVGTVHAFATRQLVNPYVGLRLGLAYMSSDDPSTFRYSQQIGAVAAGSAGLDVSVHQRAALRLGVAYDAVAYANDRSNASLSGYAALAGVLVRL